MGEKIITGIVVVITAIIGVAIVAVLVSGQAQTANVLTAGGNAFGNILKVAVSPVSGGGFGVTNGLFGNIGTLGPNYGISQ
jgi:membrane DNA delivery protein